MDGLMKRYDSQAIKYMAILSFISIVTLIAGVVLVVANVSNTGLKIGLIAAGGSLSILFIGCYLAERSRYLIIDDAIIDLPRGAILNGKMVFKRIAIDIDDISSIESKLLKGDRIVTKNGHFYSLRMKDKSIITFTLYAYGKKSETDIVTTIRERIRRIKKEVFKTHISV